MVQPRNRPADNIRLTRRVRRNMLSGVSNFVSLLLCLLFPTPKYLEQVSTPWVPLWRCIYPVFSLHDVR